MRGSQNEDEEWPGNVVRTETIEKKETTDDPETPNPSYDFIPFEYEARKEQTLL